MAERTNETRDLVIIGAGPAGLAASVYASRALLDAVTVEQTSPGGQVLLTSEVDNYPGVPSASGFDLVEAMERQARELGADIVSDQVGSVALGDDGLFRVGCASGELLARSVILATGAVPRHAGFDGEERLAGHGVSYCATCDGMFYRGKRVYVVGGGNTAAEEALFLTRFASEVVMVVRKDHMRAQAALVCEVEQSEKIVVRYRTTIQSLEGESLPSAIVLRDEDTGSLERVEADPGSFGVFVFVGHVPSSSLVMGLVDVTPSGAVRTDERMATRTPGLFCAGDVRDKPLRQIVTAVADGAVAATSAASYLGLPVEG